MTGRAPRLDLVARCLAFISVASLAACNDNTPDTPQDTPPAALITAEDDAVTAATAPSAAATTPPDAATPPSDFLFGVHYVAAWASPAAFPDFADVFRLHDATPRWHTLHTAPGQWYTVGPPVGIGLGRIDALLLFRDRNAPGLPVIYVLGGEGFPEWTRSGTVRDAWREHVRFIARRHAGSIQYYEVWNEPNAGNWYSGSTALLVDLTRIAAEEIRAADPAARIIGPSFTQDGHEMMDDFYSRDVAASIDIVGWHHGIENPEADTARIVDARRILRRHGVDRPLWMTEFNVRGGAAELARTLLIHWLYGVEMVGYYSWEMPTFYGGDDGFVHTTDAAGNVTPAGIAFGVLHSWIEGRTATLHIDGDTWSVTLDNGDIIVWTSGAASPISIPAGTRSTLDGTSSPWPGGEWTTTPEPVRFSRRDS